MTLPTDAEGLRAVESRIVDALVPLTNVPGIPPPAYVRRHLIEHAASCGRLDQHTLSAEFLPYVDGPRLRALTQTLALRTDLMQWWRQVAYCWRWETPAANADALCFWVTANGGSRDLVTHARSVWRPRWVKWATDTNEILIRASANEILAVDGPRGEHYAIVTTSDNSVVVMDVDSATTVAEWDVGVAIRTLAYGILATRRAILLVLTLGLQMKMYDLLTGELMDSRLSRVQNPVSVGCITLTDGRSAAFVSATEVAFWDLDADEPIWHSASLHLRHVDAMGFAVLPNGRQIMVTIGADGRLRRWSLVTGSEIKGPVPRANGSALVCVRLPGGQAWALTGGSRGGLQRWNLATGKPIGPPLDAISGQLHRISTAVLHDRRVVALTPDNGFVEVWDIESGEQIKDLLVSQIAGVGHMACVTLKDRRTIALMAIFDDNIRSCDIALPASANTSVYHENINRIARMETLRHGSVLVTPGHKDELIATSTGAVVAHWPFVSRAEALASIMGGRSIAAAVSRDGRVEVVALTLGGVARRRFMDPPYPVTEMEMAPLGDGSIGAILVGDGGVVQLWDTEECRPLTAPVKASIGNISKVSWAIVEGSQLVLAVTADDDERIQILDLSAGRALGEPWNAHSGWATDVAFTTIDGATALVSCGADFAVRAWSVPDAQPIGDPWLGHTGVISTVSCVRANDRTVAVTGGLDGSLRLWDVATGTEIAHPLAVPGDVSQVLAVYDGGVITVFVAGQGLACFDLSLDL